MQRTYGSKKLFGEILQENVTTKDHLLFIRHSFSQFYSRVLIPRSLTLFGNSHRISNLPNYRGLYIYLCVNLIYVYIFNLQLYI